MVSPNTDVSMAMTNTRKNVPALSFGSLPAIMKNDQPARASPVRVAWSRWPRRGRSSVEATQIRTRPPIRRSGSFDEATRARRTGRAHRRQPVRIRSSRGGSGRFRMAEVMVIRDVRRAAK